MDKSRERQSNFELLRIFAMAVIVIHHACVHSGFTFQKPSLNKIIVEMLEIGGKLGVVIFVLISGYFLIEKKNGVLKKGFMLWGQVFFYSFLFLGMVLFFHEDRLLSTGNILMSIFPVIYRQYWFFSVYIIIYIMFPYINKFARSMEEFEYKKLLIIMIVMWVIIPTLTNQQLESNEILFFLLLYLGGYMRLYGEKYKYKKHMMFKINIITLIFTWSTVLGFNIISEKIPFVGGYTTYFYGLQKVTILILAVTLFYIFENLHIKQNKLVNIVSSTTFGVYLIHDNVFMREYIWHKIVNLEVYIDSIFLPVYIVGVSVIVYIVAGGIEFIRKQTVEKIYEKILESI